MTESAYYKFKSPTTINGRAFLEAVLGTIPGAGRLYTKSLPKNQPLNRNQRCFNQFDRKTDCFDGGSGDVAYSLGEFRRTARKANGREISKSEPAKTCRATFKTVCLTQTRHDGSVNKNQPDSQILWACSQYRVDRGGGDGRGTSVRTLTMPLIWQKPGIGSTVYPLSPVLQMEPAWKGHPKYMMIPSMERAVTMDTT